ncbi:MAG: TlpA family protein disulfide reductase [Tannerella sp.]|nr:TlpA family protein disulfide reductase [Tannerella sp.]
MISFKNCLRWTAVAALFLHPGCQETTPEAAFEKCIDAEKRYNAVSEKMEQARKDGSLTAQLETSLTKESDAMFEEAKAVFAGFFGKYINTPYGQKMFKESRWVRRLSMPQMEAVIGKVTDETFKNTDEYRNAADRVKYMKASAIGNPYINIVSCDTTGNAVELSQFVGHGKYVLLDFWAAWCPDCRKEMPQIVDIYNQFKDKNFEIVSYSLDRKEDAWKKGINDLNMSWIQMSDLDYWTSKGALFYAVQWIPTTILLSPEGKILERGLSPDKLKEKLKELL